MIKSANTLCRHIHDDELPGRPTFTRLQTADVSYLEYVGIFGISIVHVPLKQKILRLQRREDSSHSTDGLGLRSPRNRVSIKNLFSMVFTLALDTLSAAPACPPSVISWYSVPSPRPMARILCTMRLACEGCTRSSAGHQGNHTRTSDSQAAQRSTLFDDGYNAHRGVSAVR